MIQRYMTVGEYDTLIEADDGRFMKVADHEAAIAEARKQERERCIAELGSLKAGEHYRLRYESIGLAEAINYLSKGLK